MRTCQWVTAYYVLHCRSCLVADPAHKRRGRGDRKKGGCVSIRKTASSKALEEFNNKNGHSPMQTTFDVHNLSGRVAWPIPPPPKLSYLPPRAEGHQRESLDQEIIEIDEEVDTSGWNRYVRKNPPFSGRMACKLLLLELDDGLIFQGRLDYRLNGMGFSPLGSHPLLSRSTLDLLREPTVSRFRRTMP